MRALAFLHPRPLRPAPGEHCVFYVISDNLILMKRTTITVTDAARNFADCVNRAHYQNVTFVLLKNGTPFARLVPHDERVCLGRELAGILAKAELSDDDARAWHHDLQAARKSLKAVAE